MKKEYCLLFLSFFFAVADASAQANCRYRNISFKAVGNVQNGSLEQDLSTCLSVVSGGDITLLQGGYLPHWRCTTTSSAIWFLGECNNYGIPPLTPSIPGLPQPPLPIPDGKGMMAIADYYFTNSTLITQRSRATYLANCLSATLSKDFFYRFDFSLGFGKPDHRYDSIATYNQFQLTYSTSPSPETLTLYGFTDSNLLPLKVPDSVRGCLSDIDKNWVELGTVVVSGDTGKWVRASIEFVSPANMNVLAIGPACNSKPPGTPPGYYYYFIDKIQLYQSYIPNASISIVAGSVCDGPNVFTSLQLNNASYFPGSDFQWYKNNIAINEKGTTLTVTKTQYGPGYYQCAIKNDSICMRSDSIYVDWFPAPVFNSLGAADTIACNGDQLVLDATTKGSTYVWDDGSTLATRPVTTNGTYSVTITNACAAATSKKTVSFHDCPSNVFVPTAFSPNNDKLNDVFKVHVRGNPSSIKVSIFNRLGQRVFMSEDLSKGWDGTINRTLQPQGTYVWVVNYTDANNLVHVERGTVVLIR